MTDLLVHPGLFLIAGGLLLALLTGLARRIAIVGAASAGPVFHLADPGRIKLATAFSGLHPEPIGVQQTVQAVCHDFFHQWLPLVACLR